jgi:hypothetical protein
MTADPDAAMIDLGEVALGTPPPGPAPPPPRRSWRDWAYAWWRPAGRRPHPWPAVAAAGALLVGTVAGSAPAVRLDVVYSLTARTGTVAADDRNLYVVSRPGPDTALTAYRLADGTRRWKRPIGAVTSEAQVDAVHVQQVGAYTMVTTGLCDNLSDARTIRIDPATGATLWSRPGAPIGLAADGLLLFARAPTGRCAPVAAGDPKLSISAVAPDGTARWTYDLPDAAPFDIALGPDGLLRWLLTIARDGRVEVRETASGTVVSDGHVDEVGPPGTDTPTVQGAPRLDVVGDLLTVSIVDGGNVRVSAYRLGSLQRRWLVHVTAAGGFGAFVQGVACGRWLCLVYPSGVLAVDPATGGTGWRWDLSPVAIFGHRLLGTDGDLGQTLHLIDGETGRTVVLLPHWQLVPALGRSGRDVVVERPGTHATTLGVLDLATGRLRVLGNVPDFVNGCQPIDGGVVCTSRNTVVRAWRLTV